MKSHSLYYLSTILSTAMLWLAAPMANAEPPKDAKPPVVLGSSERQLDRHVGKIITVRGKFQNGKGGLIGEVEIFSNLGGDWEFRNALSGKEVECTGKLVKYEAKDPAGTPLQAAAGTHYQLVDNGPIKPVAKNKP